MKIAVYATDHGYGHLSRQLGWIEKLDWEKEDQIYIVNDRASKIIDDRKINSISVVKRKTDYGPAFHDRNFKLDIEKTKSILDGWNHQIDDLVKIEKGWLEEEKIDVVISDISPVPLEASYQNGIPSLALSSFSWHWVYSSILPDHPILPVLRSMYRTATETYVLPLTEKMEMFPSRKEIPLISRVSDEKININSRKIKVFTSMGLSVFPDLKDLFKERDFDFIVPEHLAGNENVIRIPGSIQNITPFLGDSDIALMKTGYSSISEAICHRKPIIAIKREMIEDELTGDTIENLGIGKSFYLDQLSISDIKDLDIKSIEKNYQNLPDLYDNVGWKEMEKWIDNMR